MAAAKFEAEMQAFQALQREFTKVVQSRTQLESQLKENEMVSKEFDLLKDDATVYKLIGPVLVKQDRAEATTNVKKRIEFITSEIKRLEKQINEMEEKQEKKRSEMMQMQQALQAQRQQA
ncbi:hypothetical protein HK097_011117 [Rhizophlyctis rosea]|uniref:Prefoldin subunit 6 n=1 Tax=Rhizophlyctis rosea TaxID=64517 RepID=A0AAD5X3V2_9FUNG|nr:hypothetical protein HK097_011117 [Rhizophlyctis rosea]